MPQIYSCSFRMERGPVFVSFWAGHPYRQAADRLIASFRTGHNWVVFEQCRLPTWEETCSLKPAMILEARRIFKDDVLIWIDADAEIVRDFHPSEMVFSFTRELFDVYCLRPQGRWPDRVNSELLSGTLAFAATGAGNALLEQWRDRCEADSSKLDQDQLLACINNPRRQYKIGSLDPVFVCIPDLMPDVRDPYIVHHQASREHKFI